MNDDPGGNTIQLLPVALTVIFLIIGSLYSFYESLVSRLNENKVRKDADGGNKNAGILLNLLEKRSNSDSPLQCGAILFGILFSVSAVGSFYAPISGTLHIPHFVSAIIVTAVTVLLYFVFSDFLTDKIASHKVGSTYKSASAISVFNAVMRPATLLFIFISNIFVRLFGYDPKADGDAITEEEIMYIVGEGEESGAIEENEKDMIENILDFNDTTASEIMTHRTDIVALGDTSTIQEIVNLGIEEGRSRIPVYHEDIDSIVGICYVKDLLPYVGKDIPGFIHLNDILRPAYFIPETKKCSQLFKEMTERKVQIAIIVDEYGGTSGLVTLEDLVESILGNIQDEYDNEEDDITKVSEHEFTVDGTTPIDEISDLTDTDLPDGDYDTIAGFVTDKLGRILRNDEHPVIETNGLNITVLEVDEQRISKLLIKKIIPAENVRNEEDP